MRSDLLDLEVYIHQATDKAVLISSDNTAGEKVWLPFSWFEFHTDPQTGDGFGEAVITISRGRAADKGLA